MAHHHGRTKTRNPIYVLLILIAIFIIPMIAAWFLYTHKNIPHKTTNNGRLINPPFSISQLVNKESSSLASKKRQWFIVTLLTKPCNQTCESSLYNMRQIRLATGKEQQRIGRVVLTYQNHQDPKLTALIANQFVGTKIWTINREQGERLLSEKTHQQYATNNGTVYLIDPIGNVMMSYHPETNPVNILKDLKRLLKVSQIG